VRVSATGFQISLGGKISPRGVYYTDWAKTLQTGRSSVTGTRHQVNDQSQKITLGTTNSHIGLYTASYVETTSWIYAPPLSPLQIAHSRLASEYGLVLVIT